jgi:hypothetical protein
MCNVVEIMHEWRRHFLNPGDLIKLRDGPAAVCSQWRIGNVDAFLRGAAALGFAIHRVTG